jgi:hypothetical protein
MLRREECRDPTKPSAFTTKTAAVTRLPRFGLPCAVPFTVYLSSTLKDLEPERRAVQDAWGDQCIVRHSYQASEDAVVESCLADVAACDLYLGILGLRYRHVPGKPFRNPQKLSITELEYRHAGEKGITRVLEGREHHP